MSVTRVFGIVVTVAALAVVTSTSALAMRSAQLDGCPTGPAALTIQWADAHIAVACTVDLESHGAPAEVVGLIVRWTDGTVSTVSTQAPTAVAPTSSQMTSSSSSSISTSTVCINGECTTSSSSSACVDGDCSASH